MFFLVAEGFYKAASLQANRFLVRRASKPRSELQRIRGIVDLDLAVEDDSEMKSFIESSPVQSSGEQFEEPDSSDSKDALNQDSSESILERLQKQSSSSTDLESIPPTPPMSASVSFFLLNAVAVIWGTQHVVIKSTLDNFPAPSVLNFWRFSLSSLLFLPAFITVLVYQYSIYVFINTYMYI
jgi:hypothetical protein